MPHLRRRTLLTAATTLFAGACAPKRWPLEGSALVLTRGDSRVGTWVSSPWTFSTSSYWIEGPRGLVLVDTQFLPSDAVAFAEHAESVTGKKAELAVVLHANPDKFNGTDALRRRGIRVVTSAQVRAAIPPIHEKRVKAFYERYKPDYPRETPLPDAFGDATTTLEAGGTTVTAHVLGAGCSEAHVILEFEGHLFCGDLVANHAHSWLEIGKTDEWLTRLAELEALRPKRVHPGRGPSGGPELLTRQRAYLEQVVSEVAAEKPQGPPDKARIAEVRRRLEARFPAHGFPVFLEIGLPAEWRRQASGVSAGTP